MTTSGSHFGTLGAPGASFFGQNGVGDIGVLQLVSKMRSAVRLWAPKEAKRVPQGSPRDPQAPPKVAPGTPKDAPRTLQLRKMVENVRKSSFLDWKYTTVYLNTEIANNIYECLKKSKKINKRLQTSTTIGWTTNR